MKTEQLYIRGNMHSQHNEDALITFDIDGCFTLAAVLDGCSSAKESHFASALYTKVIQKVKRHLQELSRDHELDLCAFTASEFGEVFLGTVYTELVESIKQLQLETVEILTTLIMAVYHPESGQLWINVSGDGIVGVNGEVTVIDQHNVPDFLGYHIHHCTYEQWRNEHTQTFEFPRVNRFFIATDGLEKIRSHKNIDLNGTHVIEALTHRDSITLSERYEKFMAEYSCEAFDDIAMIRVISD